MDLQKIQAELKKRNMDGWLFYDFHNRNILSYRILGLDPSKITTRRWFYFIPAEGEPWKLVSMVERRKLDDLPGTKHFYLSWRELHDKLKTLLGGTKIIATQYSPRNNIPYVSLVDVGTMEIVRDAGVEVVSSADLITIFDATISPEGYKTHKEAARHLHEIVQAAFEKISAAVKSGETETEVTIQKFITDGLEKRGLVCEGGLPIVAIGDHAADPHFEPSPKTARTFKDGDTVLIDLWAKLKKPGSIFADITWCAFIGKNPPPKYVETFNLLVKARDTGVDLIRERFAAKKDVYGYEVDDVVRWVITNAGYGSYFTHRTGHSIGVEDHGNGPNIDNLETKDDRALVANVCFSIEPGIYIEGDFGVRSEIDVFIKDDFEVEVTTTPQKGLLLL